MILNNCAPYSATIRKLKNLQFEIVHCRKLHSLPVPSLKLSKGLIISLLSLEQDYKAWKDLVEGNHWCCTIQLNPV